MSKREINTTAYNKQLTDSIEKLRRVVEEKITPENINYFSPQFIKKLEGIYNYQYDDKGMVNSIDNYKFNSLIRHLKSRKVQYFRYIYSGREDITNFDIRIDVPEKFDGRNSFVLPFFALRGTTSTRPFVFLNSSRPRKYKESLNIIRNNSFIKVSNEFIDKSDPDYDGYDDTISLVIFVLYWRYV